jgi:hypothetical protein
MTMRNPLNGETEMVRTDLDPEGSFRFTWPGQPPRVVGGRELRQILAGADESMLNIEPVIVPAAKTTKITGGTDG